MKKRFGKAASVQSLAPKRSNQYREKGMLFIVLCLSFCLAGCAGLIVHPYDSTTLNTGKVLTRTVVGICTLGLSELAMRNVKIKEDYRTDKGATLAVQPSEKPVLLQR